MIRFLLPLMLCMSHTINGLERDGIALAIKKGPKTYTHPMAVGATSYMDLVKKSKVFLDTSMIIYSVIMWRKIIVLLAPRKWGKTITLDMIKTFFEMPVDDNGHELPIESTDSHRLFRNNTIVHDNITETLENCLLISEHKRLVEFYQGQVPVLYMSFKHLIVSDPILFERSIMTVIRGAVEQHKYVVNLLFKSSDDYKIMNNVLNGSLVYLHYCDALKIIFKTIFTRYEKRTIVMIDDYDAPLLNLIQSGNYTEDQINYILLVLDTFVGYVFNNNTHVRFTLLSVQFALSKPQLETPTWNHSAIDCVMTKTRECQYLGYSQKYSQQLFDQYGDARLSKNLYKWYGGYLNEKGVHFTNPYSIAKFINKKQFLPYWYDQKDQTIVNRFLHHYSDTVLSLISQQITHIFPYREIAAKDIMQIKDGLSPPHFYFYLYRIGYLTQKQSANSTYTVVKIPNNEIATIMSNWMISYYQQKHRIDEKLLHDGAVAFRDFIRSNSNKASQLDKSVQALYRNCSAFVKPTSTNLTNIKQSAEYEELFFNLIYSLTLKMQSISFFEFQVYYDYTQDADMVIYDEVSGYAVVVDLEYDTTSPSNALNRTLNCQSVNNVEKVKFIGMCMSLDEVVLTSVKLKGI